MKVATGEVWGVIPARGGSKSIPVKNLASLAGRPLIDYVIRAGRSARHLADVVCSTEDARIAAVCKALDISVYDRPTSLASDDAPIGKVIAHLLMVVAARRGSAPEAVCLLQPTSPFVLPEHIDECVSRLLQDPSLDSCQTVSDLPHNHHAFNQRVLDGGFVRFRFPHERRVLYNKQAKPRHFVFGNVVVTRTASLLDGRGVFGERSVPVQVSSLYAVDVDTQEDLDYADWLVASGRVHLDHLTDKTKPVPPARVC